MWRGRTVKRQTTFVLSPWGGVNTTAPVRQGQRLCFARCAVRFGGVTEHSAPPADGRKTMVHPLITHALRVNGRRVPVHVVSRSNAWAVVEPVPVRYDRAWRLIHGQRRVAFSRLEPLRPADALWWQAVPALSPARALADHIDAEGLKRYTRLNLAVAPVAPITGQHMHRRINKALAIAQLKTEEGL